MGRAFQGRVSGVLVLLVGLGTLSALGQGVSPPAPPVPLGPTDPAVTDGHGGAKPEIVEPVLADLLLRLRTASPLLAAARARREAARLRGDSAASVNRLIPFENPFGAAFRIDFPALAGDPLLLQRRAEVAVGTLFARIYEIDQELEVHRAGSELLDLFKESVASRYVAGQAGQEELVRAQLEGLHASERRIELEALRTERVAELNLQVGFPATTPLGRISRLPAQLPPPRGAAFEAGANAPLLLAARARLRSLERSGVGEGELSGIQRAEIEAARADLRAAEAQVQAEVAALLAAWEREDLLVAHSRDGLLPQTGLLLEATRSSFLAGRASFSAVVEAFRAWLAARIEVARHESARFVAGAELEALLLPPSPESIP